MVQDITGMNVDYNNVRGCITKKYIKLDNLG